MKTKRFKYLNFVSFLSVEHVPKILESEYIVEHFLLMSSKHLINLKMNPLIF